MKQRHISGFSTAWKNFLYYIRLGSGPNRPFSCVTNMYENMKYPVVFYPFRPICNAPEVKLGIHVPPLPPTLGSGGSTNSSKGGGGVLGRNQKDTSVGIFLLTNKKVWGFKPPNPPPFHPPLLGHVYSGLILLMHTFGPQNLLLFFKFRMWLFQRKH